MTSFAVKSRTKGAVTTATIEATSREDAISQTVVAGATGAEVEVLDVKEIPGTSAGATGATGATRSAKS